MGALQIYIDYDNDDEYKNCDEDQSGKEGGPRILDPPQPEAEDTRGRKSAPVFGAEDFLAPSRLKQTSLTS